MHRAQLCLLFLLASCTGYQVSPYVELGYGRGPGFTESQWNNTGDIVDDQDNWSVMVGFRYAPPVILAKETVFDLSRIPLPPLATSPQPKTESPTKTPPTEDPGKSDWKWLATWFAGLGPWGVLGLVVLAWIFRDKLPWLKKKNGAKPALPAS